MGTLVFVKFVLEKLVFSPLTKVDCGLVTSGDRVVYLTLSFKSSPSTVKVSAFLVSEVFRCSSGDTGDPRKA